MTEAEQIEQQAETITRYQRENDQLCKRIEALEKQADHAQPYIAKLQARITELEADQTPVWQAERLFK